MYLVIQFWPQSEELKEVFSSREDAELYIAGTERNFPAVKQVLYILEELIPRDPYKDL